MDLYRVRPPHRGHRRDDLSQVVHVAPSLVLRPLPDHKYPMRHLREAAGARARRHLQDGVAHLQRDPQLAHDRDHACAAFGHVEANETYSNRSSRNYPYRPVRRSAASATIGGRTSSGWSSARARVIVRPVADATAVTFSREIDLHFLPSVVYTDMHPSYQRTGQRYTRSRVNHPAKVCVDGDVHTQTI